jgi:hypothetical protein
MLSSSHRRSADKHCASCDNKPCPRERAGANVAWMPPRTPAPLSRRGLADLHTGNRCLGLQSFSPQLPAAAVACSPHEQCTAEYRAVPRVPLERVEDGARQRGHRLEAARWPGPLAHPLRREQQAEGEDRSVRAVRR